ncbi:hypothetical protein AB0E27_24920 [Streptomyces sparsogenes]|uniref:hypothetical protein n=1 Tax=Streptomyces sparsogenes TaxID=67365 RepID=UPI00340FA454
MASVRLIADEPRIVPWLGPEVVVEPDQVVEVPDEHADAYACQTTVWELVGEPKKTTTTTATAAKRGSKDGD